jgi:hypothetical protein
MNRLGELTDTQTPLLRNLQRSAPALNETLTRLGPFSNASRPSLRSLGDASDKGKRALRDSANEIAELRKLAVSAPALGKPLRQLLQTADDRSRGRADSRVTESAPPSPDPTSVAKSKGKGFTAFEDLLNYVYWQSLAINEFDSISHQLRVLLLVGSECASYANAQIAKEKARQDHCNAFLGPYQPGVTSPDPTEDGGPDAAAQAKKAKKLKRNSKRGAGDPEAPATPGQPDPSRPHYVLPPAVQQIVNEVTGKAPQAPSSTPSAPAAPSTPAPSDQTPGQLLDFLLGP